jgi:hypothetical protein
LKTQARTYQNTVYKAAKIPVMITEATIKPLETLNIEVFTSMASALFCLEGFVILIMTIITTIKKKVMVILSKKG